MLAEIGGITEWDVQIAVSHPENAPPDFDLSKGNIIVVPERFTPKVTWWPKCDEKGCVYAMTVTTRADQQFEDGIKSIKYSNGSYDAQLFPKNTLEFYEGGKKDPIKRIDDGVRHYGAIRVRHVIE
ncbi:MAG: hypothetical protein GY789_12005 [Hyphomicrobiales bacterium]|nr:hypothetical protein [Hyphomicrobiales bacterium]